MIENQQRIKQIIDRLILTANFFKIYPEICPHNPEGKSRVKSKNVFPKNQKELAIALDCTPQYVNKVLKGAEKLNIETITKIQNALKNTIINKHFNSQKIEIVAQQDKVFKTPKRTPKKNYKKSNKVIQFNCFTSKNNSNRNIYTAQ